MDRKKSQPFLIMAIACSAAGVVLGGTASWAESTLCIQDAAPSAECLTKPPLIKTLEGMSVGLVAGLGAAIGATVQARQN